MRKLRILAFVDYYLPGYKCGGPAVSVSRIARSLVGVADFSVFTRDRDLGDDAPFDCEADAWIARPEARVWYASPDRGGMRDVLRVVRDADPDVVYLNSFFSIHTRRVLVLRRLGLLRGVGVVIAPRGEFSPGALALKPFKKRAYILLSRLLGLYRGLLWSASAEMELGEVQRELGEVEGVVRSDAPAQPEARQGETKEPGSCKFVFVSRVSRKKNLEFAIESLRCVAGRVELDVYGPFEDERYERTLRAQADTLPANVTVRFQGAIAPALVPTAFNEGHFFLFPTQGENFGHVIAEAMAVGVPCLLSDQTPWSDVRDCEAGWAIPLSDAEGWRSAIQSCIYMNEVAYRALRGRVEDYYSRKHREALGTDVLLPFEEARRCA